MSRIKHGRAPIIAARVRVRFLRVYGENEDRSRIVVIISQIFLAELLPILDSLPLWEDCKFH